jgi:hypothetical protein
VDGVLPSQDVPSSLAGRLGGSLEAERLGGWVGGSLEEAGRLEFLDPRLGALGAWESMHVI